MKIGFEEFKLNKIIGRVMAENIASIKVLENIDLIFEKEFDFDGNLELIYVSGKVKA